ncbi:hypothetical protein RHMOL_Rhmol10G0235300 [Rhododendron molle]|uniref:Uncharacterized protein n=1 Tax=Rhododendron molle TaxID=49168 RepID=A0ACC0M6I0_RHOML|nr:hypothetical protein RHMOL_Rhmol10G0235300 [Rhododendron molle]
MGVVETKVRFSNIQATVTNCFPKDWLWMDNFTNGPVARILLSWDKDIFSVHLEFKSEQMLVVKVELCQGNKSFLLSIVYGHNSIIDRRVLWRNLKRGGAGDNKSKLDRVLSNIEWLDSFPHAEAVFLPPGISDHCLMSVTMVPPLGGRKPFKFFNFWLQHPQFQQILVSSWNEGVDGTPMYALTTKLKRLKGVLKSMNLKCYSNISRRVAEAREKLLFTQSLLFATPCDVALCQQEKELVGRYVELRTAEESFMRQRSRIKWLALGDQNTTFFHQKVCARRALNTILSLNDANGNRVEDPEAIKTLFIDYYTRLLGTAHEGRVDATTPLQNAITTRFSDSDQLMLIKPVTDEEIKKALWSINGDKAPGPDGYNSMFYQRNWEAVGPNLTAAVSSFFKSGFLLKERNTTTISLIPKVSAPLSAKDFRPISCCNVTLKCVTKVLANRLQSLLPHIINKSQSAFVKGRFIIDNVLLMQELVRGYHRDNDVPRCALKLDLMMAYDSVDWSFLFGTIRVMGFPALYVHWDHQCVTTVRYSVVINGSLEGFFQGK